MTEWKLERCSNRPDEVQVIAPGTLIQRKDIKEVYHPTTEDQPEYTDYECLSREITTSEYQMLRSIEEIDTTKAIDEYTMQLIEEGVL